ncbi:MAG: molecular chaperone DjiA [Maricaulaceae bacterium]|nr:molecular chaperone DjiA [Maricaulaceae bacterium]
MVFAALRRGLIILSETRIVNFWRKLTERLTGRGDPFERICADCPPGVRVDDADFAMALIALGAKMAKADGVVTKDEVAAFKQVFQTPPEAGEAIARAFNLAKQTTLGFDGYARRLARRFRANPAVLEDVMDALFHIARADGAVTEAELEYLKTVAEIFGFTEGEFRRLRIAHIGAAPDDPYVILGVDPDIDDAGLKRAYRRVAAHNHPDSLLARGAPPEMQRVAVAKMALINEAYAKIRAGRAAGLA